MRNQFPQGGGWSDSMGAFLFMFDFPTFPQGAEELPGRSESPKIAAGKNAAWQGSFWLEAALEAGRYWMQLATTRLQSWSASNHSDSRYGFLSL
jgi:hypothetical protein